MQAEHHDELCLEEDGDIGIDWCTPKRDMLSISLREDGSIAWAVLCDNRSASGNAQLSPLAFEVLRKLVPNASPGERLVGDSGQREGEKA